MFGILLASGCILKRETEEKIIQGQCSQNKLFFFKWENETNPNKQNVMEKRKRVHMDLFIFESDTFLNDIT